VQDLLAINSRWWQNPDMDPVARARLVFSTLRLIKDNTKATTLMDMVHLRMYGGRRAISGMAFATAAIDNAVAGSISSFAGGSAPNYNLIYSGVSTVHSRIIKSQPRVEWVPNGADYALQDQAEKLQDFIDGVFYETDTYAVTGEALKNALIFGTGIVKSWMENGELACASVFPPNLHVDVVESDNRSPRSVFEDGLMDRFVLAEMFKDEPEKQAAILRAKPFSPTGGMASVLQGDMNFLNNMLYVAEAWHLPSGPKAADGRHVLAIEGACLCDEEWKRDCFPFRFIRFDENPLGFWGRGIAELGTGHQLQMTRTLETEAMAHNLYSVPTTWVEKSSGVNPLHLQTNYPGTVQQYVGTPPQVTFPQATHPDFIAYRDWIIESFFQFLGISTTNAQATPPPGVTSGVALREYEGQVSDRWTTLGKAWEQFHLELGDLYIDLVKDEGGTYKVARPGYEPIKWNEVKPKENQFRLQCFPTSALPTTPSARKQYVVELRQDNAIDDDTMIDLLGLPDVKEYTQIRLAKRNAIKKVAYDIVHQGEYTPPDEMLGDVLPWAVDYMTSVYALGLTTNVPDDHLQLIRNWVAEAKLMASPPAPPAAPGGPGAPAPAAGAPIAKGAPPPAADLLPIGAKPGGP